MTAPNVGVGSKFCIGDGTAGVAPIVASLTSGVGTTPGGILLNILNENVAATRGIIDANALQGIRSHYNNEAREGLVMVGGAFSCNPITSDLACLLPKWFGGTPTTSGTVFPLADALPAFCIQKRMGFAGRVLSFSTVYGNVMTITASRGQPLTFDGSVVGTTAPSEAVALSGSLVRERTRHILVFHDLVITLGGTTYSIFDFSLTVNNAVDVQIVNNRVATAAFPTDRIVTISHPIPEAGVTLANFEDVEVAAVATFTYGTESFILSLPAVRYTTVTPSIQGRGETRYALNGIAYCTSAADHNELTATLDWTP